MTREEKAEQLRAIGAERILVKDGPYGSMIQSYRLDEEGFRAGRSFNHDQKGNNDLLNLTRPDVVGEICNAYLDAGADIVATNTFNSNSISLSDYGITGMAQFWKIQLPLILPSIGIISILTFVGNFNAFDLVYTVQGALAGPDMSTDILGTLLYRTFFGFQLQLGDPNMGAAIASMMFFIILAGVCVYLFAVQTRLRRYQF